MSSGDSIDPADLADELTIWASPGVIDDPARPDLGPIAVLTLVPSITADRRHHLGPVALGLRPGLPPGGRRACGAADPRRLVGAA
jgi:hypothetical protein